MCGHPKRFTSIERAHSKRVAKLIDYACAREWDKLGYEYFVVQGMDVLGFYKSLHKDVMNHDIVALERVFFNHGFAKALWGEEDYTDGDLVFANEPAWKWHLRQAVVERDPITYILETLDI